MIDPPLRESFGGNNLSIPSKETAVPVSGGEENQPVGDIHPRNSVKRRLVPPLVQKPRSQPEPRPEKRFLPSMDRSDAGSDCDTEVSVSARREWLQKFGKQHEDKYPRKEETKARTPAMTTPPKAPRGMPNAEAAASTLVNKMMKPSTTKQRNFAPTQFRPKIAKEEVQATNDGYASVAKLSQWLANDPTSTKKKKLVRRGKNVISMSRTFEKDMENIIVIETNMPRGAVQDRKKWIQGAFNDGRGKCSRAPDVGKLMPRYAMSEAGASSISVSDKKDWLKKAFKHGVEQEEMKAPVESARSEIITNDASSSLSVSDKKDWLKNAFKNKTSGGGTPVRKFGHGKAMTDVMHDRGGDDAKARAKRLFLERSRQTPTKAPMEQPQARPESKHDVPVRDTSKEQRTGPPSPENLMELDLLSKQAAEGPQPDQLVYATEEEESPVDFRRAREALIQRGKQNGQAIQVVNKVYLKKTKFEKLLMENQKHSGPENLQKLSWEEANPESGLPSDVYDQKLVSNFAPKRSFEELP